MACFKKSWWESPMPQKTLNNSLNGCLNFVHYKKWRRPTTNGISQVKLFAVKRGAQKSLLRVILRILTGKWYSRWRFLSPKAPKAIQQIQPEKLSSFLLDNSLTSSISTGNPSLLRLAEVFLANSFNSLKPNPLWSPPYMGDGRSRLMAASFTGFSTTRFPERTLGTKLGWWSNWPLQKIP